MKVLSTSYVKETPDGKYTAEIYYTNHGYIVEYYKPSGQLFKTDDMSNKDISSVKKIVENWISGIQNLNG